MTAGEKKKCNMKEKCSICSKDKGRRECKLKGNTEICSRCCAETRSSDCEGCPHYVQAGKYAVEKMKNAGSNGMILRIDPEVDKAVDDALILMEKGKIAKSESLIKDLLNEHPDIHTVQFAMGTIQANKKNYADAIVYFDKCTEIFPYCLEAWFNKGSSYMSMTDVPNAVKSFQKVIDYGDKNEDFVITAGERLRELKELISQTTGLSFDEYVQSSNAFAQAFSDMNARNYEKAIKGFNKVLSFEKNHTQSYGNIGLCHAYLGDKQAALTAFDRALAIDPDYGPALGNKQILLALGDDEKMKDIQSMPVDYYKEKVLTKKWWQRK